MTPVTGRRHGAPAASTGTGSAIVVEHTSDNNLVTFRFKNADVKMAAAEEDFEAAGQQVPRRRVHHRQRRPRAARAGAQGRSASPAGRWPSAPTVKTHDLDIPRIGYVHSWTRTQDEGWVRAALDTYGVPYTYFADQKLARRQPARQVRRDHLSRTSAARAQSQVNGMPRTRQRRPLPYKKTDRDAQPRRRPTRPTTFAAAWASTGCMNLYKFVQEGGTLITEGSTSTIFPEYNLTPGVTVETPGRPLRARHDPARHHRRQEEPARLRLRRQPGAGVLQPGPGAERRAAAAGGFAGFGGGGARLRRRARTPRRWPTPLKLSPWDAADGQRRRGAATAARRAAAAAVVGGGGGGGWRRLRRLGARRRATRPRVVLQFPANPDDMLLSGTLAGGQALAGRAQLVDAPIGKGHVVMFAIRPFWRWQTQGTYFVRLQRHHELERPGRGQTVVEWFRAPRVSHGDRRGTETRRTTTFKGVWRTVLPATPPLKCRTRCTPCSSGLRREKRRGA